MQNVVVQIIILPKFFLMTRFKPEVVNNNTALGITLFLGNVWKPGKDFFVA